MTLPPAGQQLRLCRQGRDEASAWPLPPPRPRRALPAPSVTLPPDARDAPDRLLALLNAATPPEKRPARFTAWLTEYCAALTGHRQPRDAPAAGLALLLAAAAPGLPAFAGQSQLSPDIAGQTLARLSPAWAPFSPAWDETLRSARDLLPDPRELAAARLLEAARTARLDGQRLPRGDARRETLLPYLPPLVIGPPLTATLPLTLAVAAGFPPWLLRRGKLCFAAPPQEPPPVTAARRLNALLYGLAPWPPAEEETLC